MDEGKGMRGGVAAPSRPAWRKKRGSGTRSEGVSPKPGEGLGQSPPAHSGAGAMQEPLEQPNGPSCGPALAAQAGSFPGCRPLERPPQESCPALPARPHTRLVWKEWSPRGHRWASGCVGWPPTGDERGHLCPPPGGRLSPGCPAGHWPLPAGGVRGLLILGLHCLHLGCFLARLQGQPFYSIPGGCRIPAVLREACSPPEDRPARGAGQAAPVRALLTPGTLGAVPAQGRLQVGPDPPSPVHLVDHLPTSQTPPRILLGTAVGTRPALPGSSETYRF